MRKCHEGHYGAAKILWRLRQGFWWSGLPSSVQRFVRSCLTCAQSKTDGFIRCSQGQLPSPGPYEMVNVDLVGPLQPYNGYTFLLTMEDSFTKFVKAIPLKTITANVVANAFYRVF
jgi:hypothetical protein